MKKVKRDKQDNEKDVQVASIGLLQIEEVEILIDGKWLTGQEVKDITKNYFRKNCRDYEKCHIKC